MTLTYPFWEWVLLIAEIVIIMVCMLIIGYWHGYSVARIKREEILSLARVRDNLMKLCKEK